MKKNILIYIPLICVLFISCDNYKKKYGYLVFTNSKYFQFIPVQNQEIKTHTSIEDFQTNNLEEGFQFVSTFSTPFYYSTFNHVDTFRLKNSDKEAPINIRTLKIVPIYIEYKLLEKRNNASPDEVKYIFSKKTVLCKWNFDFYSIRKIKFLHLDKLNRSGDYFENSSICPPSEGKYFNAKKSLIYQNKDEWVFE